jgi:UV DNA damage endonuclease
MQLGWAKRHPEEWRSRWKEVVSHNIALLEKILEWNRSKGILLFRISSDIVPFGDHSKYGEQWRRSLVKPSSWWNGQIANLRNEVSRYLEAGGRLTMHPAQYVSLGSENALTVKNSILSLEYHANFMSSIGVPPGLMGPINIHVSNGSKGEAVVSRVKEAMNCLSPQTRARLVFENEQSGFWNVNNLRKFFPETPITLDYHHHAINGSPSWNKSRVELEVRESWKGVTPVCHWSEGKKSKLDPAHSYLVERLPRTPFDIEVEAKGKDLAVLPFLKKVK